MKRFLLSFAWWISLALGLAALAMWVRSYWRSDLFWADTSTRTFNTKAEAAQGRNTAVPTARLMASREDWVGLVKSSGGGLMLFQGRYRVEAEDRDTGWVEEVRAPAGVGESRTSQVRWLLWRHGTGIPQWPSGINLLGAGAGVPREGKDLRLAADRLERPSIKWGFGHLRWAYIGVEKSDRSANHVNMDARGLVLPYWIVCLTLIGIPAGATAWSRWAGWAAKRPSSPASRGIRLQRIAVACLALWAVAAFMCLRSQWRRDTLTCMMNETIFGGEAASMPESLLHTSDGRTLKRVAFAVSRQSYLESTPSGLTWWWGGRQTDWAFKTGWNEPATPRESRIWQWWSAAQKGNGGMPASLAPASLLGFAYVSTTTPDPQAQGETTIRGGITIPWWFFMSTLAIAPAIWARRIGRDRKRMRLVKAGRCTNCGYDLRASTNRCPECGQAILTSPSTSSPPPQSQTTPPPTAAPR